VVHIQYNGKAVRGGQKVSFQACIKLFTESSMWIITHHCMSCKLLHHSLYQIKT